MNSVERVKEYSELESEKYLLQESDLIEPSRGCFGNIHSYGLSSEGYGSQQHFQSFSRVPDELDVIEEGGESSASLFYIPHHWPTEGSIEFKNISLQYNTSTSVVLSNMSFRIPGRKKVGIVGRTGAGKSSLVAALFRLVEPHEGSLLLDELDVLHIPLHSLRSRLAIVPQDPTLFKGSVRFNLDPFDQFSDEDIWSALRSVHMASHVEAMQWEAPTTNPPTSLGSFPTAAASTRGALAAKMVAEKGANFSVGQRQLLCLARALLRKSPVLVLDECTASVDHETDALIQQTVRSQLSATTVLCIAHRLHTIAFYDLVLVMDSGQVAEFSDPYSLLMDDKSLFHSLCKSSGDFDELLAIARDVSGN